MNIRSASFLKIIILVVGLYLLLSIFLYTSSSNNTKESIDRMRILQERKEALNIKSLSFINSQEIQEGLKGGDLDINFVKIQWEELRIIKNANIDDYESCFDTESKNGNVTTYEFTFRKRHFLIPFPLEIYTVSCNY